ncbi:MULTISPECIES: hypothetical protein [Streptomyces]|jgi:hypothetical protein|uniref:Uncharacterized protein n=1 Tax=Streptomyces spinosisporus TaxID=2927582 RepID=A0ABS9X9J2_9ACTN|nr:MULTISPECIES: hypothetical protein [Streptomyces]EPD66052.1 hypothetical protein HMPREF1211_02073 [Streptomyces sp. HGB0020]MCI3238297.1 hypothetical protein [Streptomyces spinosisporus]WUB35294.1 hypothetical protein OHN38_10380 [Streptomyces sp. NBC_00588]
MFRIAAGRSALALLAATLPAVRFFALAEPFASAHTIRQAEAKAAPENER